MKQRPEDVPLPNVFCAGGIGRRGDKVLLIRRFTNGTLGFAKGHIDPGETPEKAAVREVQEETGWVAKIVTDLGAFDRIGSNINGDFEQKNIRMFGLDLLSTDKNQFQEESSEFVQPEEAFSQMYPAEAEFLASHLDLILSLPEAPSEEH